MKTFILALLLSFSFFSAAQAALVIEIHYSGKILREGDCEVVPNFNKKLFTGQQLSIDPYSEVVEHPQKGVPVTYNCIPFKSVDKSLRYFDQGEVSWYGPGFHNKETASGLIYDQNSISTIAHKTLRLGTVVSIEANNGRIVCAIVTDRGPYHDDRIADMSYAIAQKLGFSRKGIATVNIQSVDFVDLRKYVKSQTLPKIPETC
jgi:rare lipoprotein A (peptidoglycan hydrolase)